MLRLVWELLQNFVVPFKGSVWSWQLVTSCSWLCWQSVRSCRVWRLGPGVNGIQSLFGCRVPLVSLHHHHHTVIPSAARIQQTIIADPPAFLSHNLILAGNSVPLEWSALFVSNIDSFFNQYAMQILPLQIVLRGSKLGKNGCKSISGSKCSVTPLGCDPQCPVSVVLMCSN